MNKQEWIEKISKMQSNGNNFLSLNWSDVDWEAWNSGDLTADQQALVYACEKLGLMAMPGDMAPDTISFVNR